MANLREILIDAAASVLDEGVENSKEIIAQNVTNFDNMGMANVNPGEFADGEITDKQNLVNAGEMSNDTDFEGKATNVENGVENIVNVAQDLMQDIVDISADEPHEGHCPECDNPDGKACKCGGKCHCHHPHEDVHVFEFGESVLGKYIDEMLGGKTCEQWLNTLTESNYAGPLDFVPDLRINTSDVINGLKHEIGDGSEGIHVDQIYDKRHNKAYKVSQIDEELLPKKIQIENVLLELGDDKTYYINKPSEAFPLAK